MRLVELGNILTGFRFGTIIIYNIYKKYTVKFC